MIHFVLHFVMRSARQMNTFSIRLTEDLDARLCEESRLACQPKSQLVRAALEQFLAGRHRARTLARLSAAAAAAGPGATRLAAEALPFDNESLALAEGRDPAAEWPAAGSES